MGTFTKTLKSNKPHGTKPQQKKKKKKKNGYTFLIKFVDYIQTKESIFTLTMEVISEIESGSVGSNRKRIRKQSLIA